MNKRTRLLFYISAILLTGCNSNNNADLDNKKALTAGNVSDTLLVESDIVIKESFIKETWCNGSLRAWQKAIVPFETQGNILKVNVANGEKVQAGQLLAQLDDYRQQQDVQQARLNHEQAWLDFEDQLIVSGYKVNDTSVIPFAILKMARLRSGLSAAELNLRKALRELGNTRITAPVDGKIAGLDAHAFTPTSEYKNFCTVLNTQSMEVAFNMVESDASLIKNGLNVKVLPVALPGKTFRGVVTGINPAVDLNGLLMVNARVANPTGELLDGMKVKVVVETEIPGQLIVPKTAVLARQNRQVVFTVENGHAIWNYVTTGYENSTQYTITEGLKAGQQIITGNNLTIGHDAPVKIAK